MEAISPHPFRSAKRLTQPPTKRVRSPFKGGKASGRGFEQPPTSTAEIKERVELYLYSPSGLSWLVLERNLPHSLPVIYYARYFSLLTYK